MMFKKYCTHPFTLILIAYFFALGCRLIYIGELSQVEAYQYNNQFMLNTNDGYYFAEGARDIITGHHEKNDLSPIDTATSILTAFVVKITPFSLESVIFYFPAFLGSLIVVPLILIGSSLGKKEVGFIAALIASIGYSYYNRTMLGYYDTDALNIVFPMFLIWSLILYFKSFEAKYLLFTGLEIIAYRWWYPASYSLEVAFFVLVFVVGLYYVKQQGLKNKEVLNIVKMLSIMLFAMIWLDESIRLVIVALLYFVFRNEKFDHFVYVALGLALVAFVATGGLNPIWFYIQNYIFKTTNAISDNNTTLHFFAVVQTIREAGSVPFSEFANRISGNPIIFVASFIGLVLFIIKERVILFTLPLLGLGFLAFGIPGLVPAAGLRFTIYAVPVLALGSAYLIVLIASELRGILFKEQNRQNIAYISIIALLGLGFLMPHINHIKQYIVPPVFNPSEVKQLVDFQKIAKREDYVISWWDYGYPIRFYSDVKTLVDGGKHSGEDNYPASFCLVKDQVASAKMARLAVEYTEKTKNARESILAPILKDYNIKDPNTLVDVLSLSDFKLPSKTRDIYFYLPYQMNEIFPTVALFSNLNLSTGEAFEDALYLSSAPIKEDNGVVSLENGVTIITNGSKIIINDQEVPIKDFYTTSSSGSTFNKKVQHIDPNAKISVIYMQDYNQFVILDDAMLSSTYVKLFILEEFDPHLFQKVLSNPYAKIYKLKI